MPAMAQFALNQFFPYRLAVLAEEASLAIAEVYAGRFGLSRPEWRVLAALAEAPGMTANEIALFSTLAKMQVSRAVAELEAKGLLARTADAEDRRHNRHRLTPAGRALMRRLVPLVRAREAALLAGLSAVERAALEALLARVSARARALKAGE
jgi:DNA-binding MarR family transcriptional regulator